MRRAVYLLMLAMVFTLPWENVLSLPGLGRISKLIGLVAAATWVASVLISGRFREPRLTHFLALLFVVWNAFSLLWTVDGGATQGRVITYAQLFGLMLVIWDTVDTMPRVRATLTTYLAGSYVTVLALLVGYVVRGAASERYGRVTLGSFHPNDVGMILAVSVPVAAYLMWVPPNRERRWRRLWAVGCAAYVPLAAVAVLVTGSRAALVSMIPGLAYLFYLLTRRHKAVSIGTLVGLAAVGVLAIPFVPARVLLRLEGTDAALRSVGVALAARGDDTAFDRRAALRPELNDFRREPAATAATRGSDATQPGETTGGRQARQMELLAARYRLAR